MAVLPVNADGSYDIACPLCDKPLSRPIFATTHFIADTSDRLYPYSDAAMHYECYANWKYQRRFAKQYFQAALQFKKANPYWATIAESDTFLITANPHLPEPMSHLDLQSIGPGFSIPIADWSDWVSGDWDSDCVHDLERYAVLEIEDELRTAVPDSDFLLQRAIALLHKPGA